MDTALLLSFADLENGHWWFEVRRAIVQEALVAGRPDEVRSVLDVGCGTGGTMSAIRKMFPDAIVRGVDPNAEAAEVARSTGCDVTVASFADLPVESRSVDILLALDVLEHCDDDRLAGREAFRVLRPGGIFLCTVPALGWLWSLHDELNHHYRRYGRLALRNALTAAGFDIARITHFNAILLPVGLASRVAVRVTRSAVLTGVERPNPLLNRTLRSIFAWEVPILRRVDLPVGMSLLAVARRPKQPVGSPHDVL